MQYNLVEIPCRRASNQWFTIVPMGDIHEGNVGCCLDTLRKEIRYILETPNCFCILMGDLVEAINVSDPRFDLNTVAKKYRSKIDRLVQYQVRTIVDELTPIAHKIIGVHRGNHETKVLQLYHYDVTEGIINGIEEKTRKLYGKKNGIKLTALYDTSLTRLRFINRATNWVNYFNIVSWHGNVGGRKPGGKVNRLTDVMADHDADIFFMAHAHTRDITLKDTLFFDRTGKPIIREGIGAVTGSFLKGYVKDFPSYVEKGMFPPLSIGTVRAHINPCDDLIELSVRIKRKKAQALQNVLVRSKPS